MAAKITVLDCCCWPSVGLSWSLGIYHLQNYFKVFVSKQSDASLTPPFDSIAHKLITLTGAKFFTLSHSVFTHWRLWMMNYESNMMPAAWPENNSLQLIFYGNAIPRQVASVSAWLVVSNVILTIHLHNATLSTTSLLAEQLLLPCSPEVTELSQVASSAMHHQDYTIIHSSVTVIFESLFLTTLCLKRLQLNNRMQPSDSVIIRWVQVAVLGVIFTL